MSFSIKRLGLLDLYLRTGIWTIDSVLLRFLSLGGSGLNGFDFFEVLEAIGGARGGLAGWTPPRKLHVHTFSI
jgi:hypothetical protein